MVITPWKELALGRTCAGYSTRPPRGATADVHAPPVIPGPHQRRPESMTTSVSDEADPGAPVLPPLRILIPAFAGMTAERSLLRPAPPPSCAAPRPGRPCPPGPPRTDPHWGRAEGTKRS